MSVDYEAEFAKLRRGRFEPKLSVDQRCEILALLRCRAPASALALMYSIDRQTVIAIGKDGGSKYKSTRLKMEQMGMDAFRKYYATDDLRKRALDYARKEIEEKPSAFSPDPVPVNPYNSKRVGHRGHHIFQDVFGIDTDVMIEWRDDIDGFPPAWYYANTGTDNWVGPYYTSSSALEGARTEKTQSQINDGNH